ncbi:MAG: hypothetical protein ING77_12930 [Rhodocyclaceae bacterium]|nr:hypothetical protein [Rhodocyclaceae bacterium]
MSKDNGGPAFPFHHFDLAEGEGGMTLRDYFAAKALQGFAAGPGGVNTEKYAQLAYRLADAMLAERSKA